VITTRSPPSRPRLAATFRTAIAILGTRPTRDATQEIFLRAWRNLPRLRGADRFDAWFRPDRGQHLPHGDPRATAADRARDLRRVAAGRGRAAAVCGAPHDDRTADLDVIERALDRLSTSDHTLLALHR
jgi:hypothetical protein